MRGRGSESAACADHATDDREQRERQQYRVQREERARPSTKKVMPPIPARIDAGQRGARGAEVLG